MHCMTAPPTPYLDDNKAPTSVERRPRNSCPEQVHQTSEPWDRGRRHRRGAPRIRNDTALAETLFAGSRCVQAPSARGRE